MEDGVVGDTDGGGNRSCRNSPGPEELQKPGRQRPKEDGYPSLSPSGCDRGTVQAKESGACVDCRDTASYGTQALKPLHICTHLPGSPPPLRSSIHPLAHPAGVY